jgi:hypothetical protein
MTFFAAIVAAGGCELPVPEAPEAPEAPEEAGALKGKGNCCLRSGKLLETKCGGAPCCAEGIDEKACHGAKGYWFFSAEGCAGAC